MQLLLQPLLLCRLQGVTSAISACEHVSTSTQTCKGPVPEHSVLMSTYLDKNGAVPVLASPGHKFPGEGGIYLGVVELQHILADHSLPGLIVSSAQAVQIWKGHALRYLEPAQNDVSKIKSSMLLQSGYLVLEIGAVQCMRLYSELGAYLFRSSASRLPRRGESTVMARAL